MSSPASSSSRFTAARHLNPDSSRGCARWRASLGLVLIFDETVTGFRLAYGGAQEYYGVRPDLATLGKALGGGYPIGAVAGRADIVDLVREDRLGDPRYVWFASSIGGNPISTAAGCATLGELRRPTTYERLFGLGERLRSGLRGIMKDAGIAAQVQGEGPLAAVVFTDREIVDYRTAHASNRELARAYLLGLFRRGIFLNPMSTKLYLLARPHRRRHREISRGGPRHPRRRLPRPARSRVSDPPA